MRVSLEWLSDYVELDPADAALAGRIAEGLLLAGLEVEAVERPGEALEGMVVGEVLEAGPHPNADRLKLCRVSDGKRARPVVCGAPNVAAGQRVVLALPGSRLPGGQAIEAVVIRGERSEGMICSARELGLGEDHSGIIVLEGSPAAGSPAAAALGLDDVILDISITPNRADCLSVLGVAREAAALLGRSLRAPEVRMEEDASALAASLCQVEILDPAKCPRYVARIIRGVAIGPSPAWMQRRLRAAGMRPISNVVDVTNYAMLSLGQPLHAFDLARLAGRRIVVRRWRPEDGPFRTLDGQERRMEGEDLMICDARRPVAIGGVMGGLESEVSGDTRDILLESAYFAPSTIRRTRRRLGLSTEASYRFERGVDPGATARVAAWAADLIRQAAGGKVAQGEVDCHPMPVAPAKVRLRHKRVSDILGLEVPPAQVRRELEALGMKVGADRGGACEVEVPTFRPDVEREIDLIEEIARRQGYGRIPSELPPSRQPAVRPGGVRRMEGEAREAMLSAGYSEAINYSFVSSAGLARLGMGEGAVPLRNPLSAEMDVLRTTLLAGLLGNAALNLNRGVEEVRLFEIGRTFHPNPGQPLPREASRLAALRTEGGAPALWPDGSAPGGEQPLPRAVYELKGAVERLGALLRLPGLSFGSGAGGGAFAPGASAAIRVGGAEAGAIGVLGRGVLEAWGLRQGAAAFELDLGVLLAQERPPRRFEALPRFPANLRDLAVVVPEKVAHGEVEALIREAAGELLESAALFDVYRSQALAQAGEKSLAYSLVFRHPERTLTDAEANRAFEAIVERLARGLGARLRA
ncbi:MAG: phenylalanine--tRNA ligase subunit beta [Candidatus Tectomicrobia bacterium RIFCSPLOWO2_12_FULL_69_37]|nr:MAG: phenylalanine--tRNA ligase subunit beta [Candidatus Tectomicrobia bacterium RIFCSPLOWO2_02_FULL_70_19]OGL61741.1 MAG: phenylalanine--tRNA ligase subunit beta [Candidatus Tectomicrobia bacterium RIFCSPLOWO2_12_FULL_69_37]